MAVCPANLRACANYTILWQIKQVPRATGELRGWRNYGRISSMNKRIFFAVAAAILAFSPPLRADDDLCVDGVCYLTKEAADAARAAKAAGNGVANPMAAWAESGNAPFADDAEADEADDLGGDDGVDDDAALKDDNDDDADVFPELETVKEHVDSAPVVYSKKRMRMGACSEEEFIGFLGGEKTEDVTEGKGFWALLIIALLCGLMDNLTPCVLPLIPVNLAIIGRSAARGAVYGLGQITGAGVMGLVAALVGARMGSLQSSIGFNIVAAVAMTILGLAMLEVFTIDFTKFKKLFKGSSAGPAPRGRKKPKKGVIGVWALGAASVLLAGACVEPVLLALLLKTAEGVGAGNLWYAALPFAFGLGLALPWPFIGAGLGILPKPGVWMVWLKRALALVVFAFAARYAYLAWRVGSSNAETGDAAVEAAQDDDSSRPELVILSAPWCMNCYDMERTVLRQPAVLEAMRPFRVRHLTINVFEDLAQYPELAGLGIQGLPCYVILEK